MAKEITLEKLAQMIQRGFEEAATKKELQALREDIDQRFEDMEQRFQAVNNNIDALHSEIREIKLALPPLLRTVAQLEVEVTDLRQRISRLERKAGLTK